MKKCIPFIVVLFSYSSVFGQITDSTSVNTDSIPKVTEVASLSPSPKPKRDNRPFNERVSTGFGGSFWITPSTTYIEIAPSIAYRFPKTLTTGLGFRYIYRHDRVRNNDLHSYGPNIFARANLTKRIYFWTEYEYLFSQYFDRKFNSEEYSRKTADGDSWFVGLGYQRTVGKRGRGGISVQFLYNVLYKKSDAFNPYFSAYTYRVGYFF